LTNLFVDYNKCVGGNYKNYTLKNSKTTKSYYNFNFKTGLNVMSFSILDINFENKIALRLGVEVEYIMGFNNNKWAFVVEPNFLNFSTVYNDRTERVSGADNSAKINYKAIDLPIGIRYYMYLSKTSKFFLNSFLVPSITLKSEIRSIGVDENNPLNFDGKSDINYAVGIGYKYKDKFSVELRTSSQRDLLNAVGPARLIVFFITLQ
jgi:hypothetical protein